MKRRRDWRQTLPFQHTAARRRLGNSTVWRREKLKFQHTAARRRLVGVNGTVKANRGFQHTAARRRLGGRIRAKIRTVRVSTHSRPKAAGRHCPASLRRYSCFNTQPPEGGWRSLSLFWKRNRSFNTQPPEGGWAWATNLPGCCLLVSTHSRPKAAGTAVRAIHCVSCRFNTQPPEGGWGHLSDFGYNEWLFQHTAARRRLEDNKESRLYIDLFQHTAARRRLGFYFVYHKC